MPELLSRRFAVPWARPTLGLALVLLLSAGGVAVAVVWEAGLRGAAREEARQLSALVPAVLEAADAAGAAVAGVEAGAARLAELRRAIAAGLPPAGPRVAAAWSEVDADAAALLARSAELHAVHKAARELRSSFRELVLALDDLVSVMTETGATPGQIYRATRQQMVVLRLILNLDRTLAGAPGTDTPARYFGGDVLLLEEVLGGLLRGSEALAIEPLADADSRAMLESVIRRLAPVDAPLQVLRRELPVMATARDILGTLEHAAARLAEALASAAARPRAGAAALAAARAGEVLALLTLALLLMLLVGLRHDLVRDAPRAPAPRLPAPAAALRERARASRASAGRAAVALGEILVRVERLDEAWGELERQLGTGRMESRALDDLLAALAGAADESADLAGALATPAAGSEIAGGEATADLARGLRRLGQMAAAARDLGPRRERRLGGAGALAGKGREVIADARRQLDRVAAALAEIEIQAGGLAGGRPVPAGAAPAAGDGTERSAGTGAADPDITQGNDAHA